MKAPRFVAVAAVAALISLALSVLIAWQLQHNADVETQKDCERSASYREDSRAMWLYLLGTASPNPSDEERAKRVAFVRELNERLPSLRCDNGNLVPESP